MKNHPTIHDIRGAQQALRRVPLREQCFFAKDGSVFCSLKEFLEGLKRMHPDTFKIHSNAAKSDFANWVRDVIGDETLAHSLEVNRKNQANAIARVENRLAKLDETLGDAAAAISHPSAHDDDHLYFF